MKKLDGSGVGMRAREWWQQYCSPDDGDPGVRARLRRCRTAVEAMTVPAAIDLARRLEAFTVSGPHEDELLARSLELAGVLANIKRDTSTDGPRHTLLRSVGYKALPRDGKEKESDRPRLSEARFRRLVQVESGEEQTVAFRRLIALLGGEADVVRLAGDYWEWSDPYRRDRVRQRWAVEYYAADISAMTPTSMGETPE